MISLFFVLLGQILSGSSCDQTLWRHVYNPQRLTIHEACVSVTGQIVDATNGKRKDGLRHEADGDSHGWLTLDVWPVDQSKYLNAGNQNSEDGNLVFEVVCMFKVTQKDAKGACKDYKNTVVVPPPGTHVRITGTWVMDDNHDHWNEIHPVTKIEVISESDSQNHAD